MKKILIPVLLCSLWACKKDEKPQPEPPAEIPDLIVTVWDATRWDLFHTKGLPTADAKVQLFTSKKDFLDGRPTYTATADQSGKALFENVTPGKYFILAFKQDMLNIWTDANGNTMVSDTLFQSETEIKNPQTPLQSEAMPGDFRFKDLNGDMIINASDVAEVTSLSYDIKKDGITTVDVMIGYKSNSKADLFKTTDEVETQLNTFISNLGVGHNRLAILDGVLSDDADCSIITYWCDYDKFTFNASTEGATNIFNSYLGSILWLNKMLLSLQQINGDHSVLTAQIRAYRAFIYLELQTYFGQLPIIKNEKIGFVDLKRASWEETRSFIKTELKAALPALPAIPPANTTGRVTSYAAHMLLARLAFQESDVETLIAETDAVIDSKAYELVDYSTVFTNPSNHEIIWTLPLSSAGESTFTSYFVRNNIPFKFFPVIRYTETWLLRAYGKAMSNDLSGTKDAINTIRARSNKPVANPKNMDEAIAELGSLYKDELYREGFRYAFLVLTNQAKQVLADKGYKDHHMYLPIPSTAISMYPNMTQNAGY
ncbi:RagB/SusD family nutrient uptake outer membrane protein [Chitinophaga pinensis]|uniref:SusD-like N-terminal domain-containing protein n=1 Tax=Chitinophaga pinensis (strain ATCC 43595 / DSM 2588 / LMG 13176 / NBRC 15968 / NCIMB 11800 / UQM 2034) TaxID=485918 RepID=A0A979GQV0_CHIPD|nr:RagB/SusD family nutrient uptake outer membrane protein [Chitinophaga pinensis]ACU58414.1 hypothetical protein Cpin_0916 [Chitinophaga pinensis DSM 2588]